MSNFPKRLTVKVNLDNINRDRLYKGKKGTYLDLVLFNTPESEYGEDFVVRQDLGKEAREQGEQQPILGNAKAWALGEGEPAKKEGGGGQNLAPSKPARSSDDLPF